MDLASNNLQWLMCHKTKPNQTFLTDLLYKPRSNCNGGVLHTPESPEL